VDSLGLFIPKNKLKAISKLKFSTTLKGFKTYLGMSEYLKHYIPYFAQISEALQKRKVDLLKPAPKGGQAKKNYAAKTYFSVSTKFER